MQGGGIYPYGSVVEISAIPQPGYSFVGWTGGDFHDATAAFTTLTLSEDTNATAQFEPIFYSITVNSSQGGNVSSDGGEFEYGYNYSLTAIADEGYSFQDGKEQVLKALPFLLPQSK